jgi:O-succinylbenzoic acid--CoA ligase
MAELTAWPWQAWADKTPFAIALKSAGKAWCWKDLQQRVDSLCAGFARQGVVEGRGVALRGKNSLNALLSYLALLQAGARLLPLNPQLPAALCDSLLPQLDIDFILDLSDRPLETAIPALTLSHGHCAMTPSYQPARIATLTLTSGSSGLPKAAAHSVAAHLACARGVLGLIPFCAANAWLLSLPLFHVSGQGIVWRWLTAGAQLAVAEELPLAEALQGCSHASLVPTQLWRLLNQSRLPASLTDVLLGGAEIPLELTQRAERAGVRCWCGYGMTETASTVTAKRADGAAGVGEPLAGREVRIVEDEILIRSESLAAGYWRQGKLAVLTDGDGWFHTRDRGAWRDRELQVAGRLDNLFFSGGEGIQPEDIERVLAAHPRVERAFVLPMADAEFGQRPVALIDRSAGMPFETLSQWLEGKLASFQQPVRYFDLPADIAQGGIKVSRRRLQEWLAEQIA